MRGVRFYVNGTTGSDTLDSGRGESASKPFKTIQAAVNYVCDSYNVSRYTATIQIAEGTYNETVSIGGYSRGTGTLCLSGDSRESVIINAENRDGIRINNSYCNIQHLTINFSRTTDTTVNLFPTGIACSASTVDMSDVSIQWNCAADFEAQGTVYGWCLRVFRSSTVTISNKCYIRSNDLRSSPACDLIIAQASASITVQGSNTSNDISGIEFNGNCSNVLNIFNSLFGLNNSFIYDPIMSGTVTGRRYKVADGGGIATGGKGEEFFPGTIAGTVDASTYSWYS